MGQGTNQFLGTLDQSPSRGLFATLLRHAYENEVSMRSKWYIPGKWASSATNEARVSKDRGCKDCATHSAWFASQPRYRNPTGSKYSNMRTSQRCFVIVPTMLNQSWNGGESSRIRLRRMAAIKGNMPNIRLSILYLPVRCMIHLFGDANT